MGVEAEWLNLTAFPPMVTGITTVINSAPVTDVSGCVNPQSVWSCDSPPPGYQVNFRFEIRFRNDTLPKNETQIAKRGIYSSNPATPSNNDQFFIGEYTDNVTAPYNGELTPFYISLLNASALTENSDALDKRQSAPYPYPTADDESVSLNASTTAPKTIPRPLLSEDGSPAQSILYPFAAAQPLRLYNRGQSDEHYGFYTYFDRTIYTSSFYPNSSGALELENEARSNEVLANATAVCTWSQTRLHVQIWTRKTNVATLSDRMPLDSLRAINSTANDMLAPGSFPMPVTISLDRHGGKANQKGVYCYGLNSEHKVLYDTKSWIHENRAFGGVLVNPASVPTSDGTTFSRRHNIMQIYGGVDGGTGGCLCQWRNWI
ncbi:hypothetical protein M433DRAFT_59272 [Acidomyces richmondensis BFW]|nr:MAG: hypothetical protein FE78DRAFT_144165 [Acidomyces sp. 'richmondensis']KYG49380.1 hypothetical protein M433DRAFT_59272 [Acidomyces richmondensis BFW]